MSRVLSLFLLFGLTAGALPAEEAMPVRTALLGEVATYPERSAPAAVISLNDSTISAEIAARVVEIPVRVGDVVDPGGSLAVLECTDFRLALREAEARVNAIESRIALAGKQLERTRALSRSDSISREALDERETALTALQADQAAATAALEVANTRVSRCNVASPFRALVTDRIAAVGEFATPGTPLVEILDLVAIEVSAQLAPADVPLVREADGLYFSYGDNRFALTLRTVLPAIDPDTRTREARFTFSRDEAIAGAAGKLLWRDPRPHVPAGLLVERDGRIGMFTVVDGRAGFRPLPDARAGLSAPVALPAGTRIVTEGHYSLRDNAAVRPAE